MPLTIAEIGEFYRIQKIGGKEETRRFLMKLGFVVGEEVAVMTKMADSVIVRIKDTRVAISSEMARRILLSPGKEERLCKR